MITGTLEQSLLNDYQRDFPLIHRPFQAIAEQLRSDETKVLTLIKKFTDEGVVSRVGPVFRPNTIGRSTLAAIAVPQKMLQGVADIVSGYTEVNHNYEREHHFNLWFVINTTTPARCNAVLEEIKRDTGFDVMSLPLVRDYYIDLGFDLDFSDALPAVAPAAAARQQPARRDGLPKLKFSRDLIATLQGGLPLVCTPYLDVARRTGLTETVVLNLIHNMQRTGAIKRFGVVVRHHELGYRANAMCVWDVPDRHVDKLGKSLAEIPYVTLCYQRPRRPPAWPYNLFCMVHGKDRGKVLQQVDQLIEQFQLRRIPHEVLFSGRRFKQRGAYYRQPCDSQRDAPQVNYG